MTTIAPNRHLSVLITVVGTGLFFGAAMDLLPVSREVWAVCLFFGLTMLAGGVVLLLIEVPFPPPLKTLETEELLEQEQYEQAFRLVLAEQAKPRIDNESAVQRGVDFLVANGIAPDEATKNLHSILISFLDQNTAE